jgi:hypothetical protein
VVSRLAGGRMRLPAGLPLVSAMKGAFAGEPNYRLHKYSSPTNTDMASTMKITVIKRICF